AAVRGAAPLLDLAHDAAGDVVAGQQLGGTPRVAVPLRVAPPFVLVVRRLPPVQLRNVVEHEAAPLLVEEDPSLPAHPFGDDDPADGQGPDHPGGVELEYINFDHSGRGVESDSVARDWALPTVRSDRG